MKKLLMMFAVAAAILVTGCTVTKIEYEKESDGRVEYKIWHNDHWLKRETGAMSGGMSDNGKFEVKLENAAASPSEEFNRTMQTYMTTFIQLAQIAAAAYNPSASAAVKGEGSKAAQSTIILEQPKQEEKPTNELIGNGVMLTASQGEAEGKADAATTQDAASMQKADECADGTCKDGACKR